MKKLSVREMAEFLIISFLFCIAPGEFSASDSSLTDIQDQRKQPMPDPGLMPLPDSASDLDWSNLVDAAKAFEGKYSKYLTWKAYMLLYTSLRMVF